MMTQNDSKPGGGCNPPHPNGPSRPLAKSRLQRAGLAALASILLTLAAQADQLNLRTEISISKGLAWKDRAILVLKGHDGAAEAIIGLAPGVVEVASARHQVVPLRFPLTPRLAPGNHDLLLKQRERGLVICVAGRVVGTHPQIRLQGRPKATTTNGKRITLDPQVKTQRIAPIGFSDGFARLEEEGEPLWETLSGEFALNTSRNPGSSQSAFQLWGGSPHGEGRTLAKQSLWFWDDYQAGVSVTVSGFPAAWGLIVASVSESAYHLLRWSQESADQPGTIQLLRRNAGRETLLAETPLHMRPNQWYRATVAMYGTDIKAFISGKHILQATDDHLLGGRLGLYLADTETAYFDDVTATSLTSPINAPGWTPDDPFGPSEQQWSDFSHKSFYNDEFMMQWAHPRSFWEQEDRDGMAWFRTRFFDNVSVSWTREPRQTIHWPQKPLRIALFADPADEQEGYLVSISSKRVELQRQGQVVAAEAHAQDRIDSVAATVNNGKIRIRIHEQTVIEWQDPTPLRKGRIGASLGRTAGKNLHRPDWRDSFRTQSSQRLDYGFDHAPTAWEAQSGTWRGTHRWACVPKWSFFGGRPNEAHGNAMLWNLRRFKGDVDIEIFAAPMEGTPQRVHFSWPTNIGVAFAADGNNLDTGYFLHYGAYDVPTELFRLGRNLALCDSRVMPGLRLRPGPWYQRVTRVWQHLRIQRRGGRILVDAASHDDHANYLGLERLFDIEDPNPPGGDRFGLWTWGPNGLAIARATISFEESPGPAETETHATHPEAPENDSFQRCRNSDSGGTFARDLLPDHTPVNAAGTLEFRWRSPDPLVLSVVAQVRGHAAEAILAGPEAYRSFTIPVTAITQDDTAWPDWRQVRIRWEEDLRQALPEGPLLLDSIRIASPCERIEEIAGLGVNRRGAFFDLADVRWVPDHPQTGTTIPQTLELHVHGQRVLDDFEATLGDWQRLGGHDGALLSRDRQQPAAGEASLRLMNPVIAGPAGAWITREPYPLSHFPELAFDYRVPDGVEINLLVRANGRWFEVTLSGTDASWPVIGRVTPWIQDGTWRHARIDLAAALTRRLREPVLIEALALADTMQMSTRQRAAYWIDNLVRIPAVSLGSEAEIRLHAGGNRTVVAHSLVLDDQPHTDPGTTPTGQGNAARFTPTADTQTAHLRAHFADGSWSHPLHLPLRPQAAPLPEPPQGTTNTTPDDAPPAPPRLLYRPRNRLKLTEFEWQKTPTFPESQLGEVGIRRGAWVLRNSATAAAGQGSIEVVTLDRNSFFSAYLQRSEWNPKRWPMVSFDYAFPQAGCALNLSLLVNGAMTVVEWTGSNDRHGYFAEAVIGRTERAKQDGSWHHVEFNLLDMIRKTRFPNQDKQAAISAAELATWATNHHGSGYVNPHEARVRFDNIAIYSEVATEAEFEWNMPPNALPVKGYSTLLDTAADTNPPDHITTRENRVLLTDLKPGTHVFHVKACDQQGRWGAAAHRRFTLKANESPQEE